MKKKLQKSNTNRFRAPLLIAVTTIALSSNLYAQNDDVFNATIEENNEKAITGGFGADLAKKVSFVNFNGYITNEFFAKEEKNSTFDNHYFNIFISSQLTNKIFVEGQLEYEHGGQDIDVRYAYADYKISDALVIRSGKFLVPAGQFNEYLYPEYLSKTISRAWVNREISPSAWGEVGVQLRGKINTSSILTPFYTAYLVNGLNDEEGVSGNGIRSLRGNMRDSDGGNDNKAIGLSVGTDIGQDITISTNYYTGKYTSDNALNLSILGASFYLDKEKFSLWGEYHYAHQEAYINDSIPSDGSISLNKQGFFVQGGYMVTEKLETVVRYDAIDLDGNLNDNRSRVTFGLNYYLAETAVVKVNYELINDEGTNLDDNLFGIQFSIGF